MGYNEANTKAKNKVTINSKRNKLKIINIIPLKIFGLQKGIYR